LVFLSRAATARYQGAGSVFRREIEAAIRIQERKGADAPFIVPVRIEPCDIPAELGTHQWFDLFERGTDDLAKSLARSVRSRAPGS
jgi:hypothetical protein